MLVIGHRGAAGLAPENSLEAMKRGQDASADMLEFDVQLTRDKIPVVIHDLTLFRTHRKFSPVRWTNHASLADAAAKGHQIVTLEEVLDEFFGTILLNLELKGRGCGDEVTRMIQDKYIKSPDDWSNILFSSFTVRELGAVRAVSEQAELSMLHFRNPFLFIAHHRRLQFSAVGFHRHYMNDLATQIAKRAGLFRYVYTVNRPESAKRLAQKGFDAVVTDHPDQVNKYLRAQSV